MSPCTHRDYTFCSSQDRTIWRLCCSVITSGNISSFHFQNHPGFHSKICGHPKGTAGKRTVKWLALHVFLGSPTAANFTSTVSRPGFSLSGVRRSSLWKDELRRICHVRLQKPSLRSMQWLKSAQLSHKCIKESALPWDERHFSWRKFMLKEHKYALEGSALLSRKS